MAAFFLFRKYYFYTMNLKSTLFSLLFIAFIAYSCSEEKMPASLVGTWNVKLIEIVDCNDTLGNVFASLFDSTCYRQGNDSICIDSFKYTFEANTYMIDRVQEVNGVQETSLEQGNYTIENLNRLVLCKPDCDSLLVVRNGNQLEIVDIDTISGCSTLIRAVQ